MTKLSAIEDTLKAMQGAIQKLDTGKLNKDELDRLVSDAQLLHEKLIILRYKAYEQLIYGENVTSKEPIVNSWNSNLETEGSIEAEVDNFIETNETENQLAENFDIEKDQPNFDFSLFEEEKELIEEENIQIEETNFSANKEFTDSEEGDENEREVEYQEPIQEEITTAAEIEVKDTVDPIQHISTITTHEDHFGVREDHSITETTVLTPSSEENRLFISKFGKIDADEVQQVSISKLSTLVGAFGLNERLQCINELFDGSSEGFIEAIKALDNVGSLDEAILIASEFSTKHSWDLNSETVDEFVFKIKRRYA